MAPFFRFPGLLRARGVEDYLASKGIQVWSADFLADDWRHISPQRVYELAIKRLEAYGKGILLLHDIQARTVAALPKILHELKARGYHIVQVVPATPERPATPTEPQEWRMHPPSENVPIARWPKVPNFVFAEADALAAPALSDFDAADGELLLSAEPFERVRRLHGVPLPREAPWPREPSVPQQNAAPTLPVPAASLFQLPEKVRVAFQSLPSDVRHAEVRLPKPRQRRRRLIVTPPAARGRTEAGTSRMAAGPRPGIRCTPARPAAPRSGLPVSGSARA